MQVVHMQMSPFVVGARVRSSQGIWRGINEPNNRNKATRRKEERKYYAADFTSDKTWEDAESTCCARNGRGNSDTQIRTNKKREKSVKIRF